MNRKKVRMKTLSAAALILGMTSCKGVGNFFEGILNYNDGYVLGHLSNSSQGDRYQEEKKNARFVFTGEGKADTGRALHYSVIGKQDNTILVAIDELPRLSMDGTWTFVENKGYKLYFNDGNGTFAYTKYNAETKAFTFRSMMATGNYGSPEVSFSYVDADFAYDGIGLGNKPPLFNIEGYNGGTSHQTGIVTCNEDGTFKVGSSGGLWWVYDRTEGKWVYNETEDQYELTFNDPYAFKNRPSMRQGEEGATCRVFTGNLREDPNAFYTLSYEEYVNNNYYKGPYIATHKTNEEGKSEYDLKICLDFGSDELCYFYGSCIYDE